MERKGTEKGFYDCLTISSRQKEGLEMAKLSKLVAVTVIALLSISVLAALSQADSNQTFYVGQVNATGTMTLGWFVQTDIVNVTANFTARIPTAIVPGTYNATFQGFARITEDNIDFNGAMMTENGTFQAEFEVPNAYTLPKGMCGATGQLVLVISQTVLPPPVTFECISVVGSVTNFGSSPAMGCLQADAKIVNSTASTAENESQAHVTWIPVTSTPLPVAPVWNATFGNYTYSYYSATLINATDTELNYTGNDLYIAGVWSVLNVTFSFTGMNWTDWQTSTSYLRQNATGTLEVYGNWKNFTLSITGFDDVIGTVDHVCIRVGTFLDGDVLGHGVVDIYDLVYVARYMGAVPGDPRFGGLSNFGAVSKADVCGDGSVDIYDLVTVASQMGQTG
jgi:hypothetical protein